MIAWLFDRWHAYQRRLDLHILWPSCKAEAARRGGDLDHAKAAFALHAFNDKAWTVLGHDAICARVDKLT